MGQFSWITQDTNESIRCNVLDERAIAYMHDNKGNVWEENCYEGYGEFGGKDFFQLLAEMNNVADLTGDVEKDRLVGIDLYYSNNCISPNLTRNKNWIWIDDKPEDDINQGWGEEEQEEDDDCFNDCDYDGDISFTNY